MFKFCRLAITVTMEEINVMARFCVLNFGINFLHLPLRSHGFCKEKKLMSAFYHQYARRFLSASFDNHALQLKMLSDMRT